MELKKLDESFYNDNPKIIQALDFDHKTQQWSGNKVRGHGIVSITINGLTFAIPVRSYIKHRASFILEVNKKLLGKEGHITKQFDKYVNRYIKAVQKDDQRVLNSNEYRFTTLVNYHTELSL